MIATLVLELGARLKLIFGVGGTTERPQPASPTELKPSATVAAAARSRDLGAWHALITTLNCDSARSHFLAAPSANAFEPANLPAGIHGMCSQLSSVAGL